MLSETTLPIVKSAQPGLKQEVLYALGLRHVRRLASRIWTDYNVHDPGVTTLELLCYALTDLSYRASFPVEDLLACATDDPDKNKKAFFTAREILPNRALTLLDYRKLLIDLKGVKNAWLMPAPLSYYADKINGTLFGPATLYYEQITDLPTLAGSLKSPANALATWLVSQLSPSTAQALAAYPGTGEDARLQSDLLRDLNRLIGGKSIYDAQRFAAVSLSPEAQLLIAGPSAEASETMLNRILLEDAFASELARNVELRKHIGKPGIQEAKIRGLYDVVIDFTEDITSLTEKADVMSAIKARLQANRNLCEDFNSFDEVVAEDFLLCAELELAPDADTSKVEAQIFFQVQNYLAPAVTNYTLDDMLHRTKPDGSRLSVDEIFAGPVLDCGFIDDAELAAADLPTEIRLSDVISRIMDIEGVRAVRDIVVNPKGTAIALANKWLVPIEARKKALLDRKTSRLVYYKRNMPITVDKTKAEAEYIALVEAARAKEETPRSYDFDIPAGRYRDLASYHSFQNHFPAVYGLSRYGLTGPADDGRKALALQLKAYLLFFDQLMANYLVQLSQARKLLSADVALQRTYFAQVVDSFAEHNRIYGADPSKVLTEAVQDAATFAERRNRFLNHLIARFAERFTEYAHLMYSEFGYGANTVISAKCDFLQDYPAISSERSLAWNYSFKNDEALWNSGNVSGLERRLARLLGIRNFNRRNLGDIAYELYAEFDKTPGDEFRWRILNKDTGKILFSGTRHFATKDLAKKEMQTAIDFGMLPASYQRKTMASGRHYFNVINGSGKIVGRRIEYFGTAEQMEAAIDELMRYLQVHFSDEGMYLIESILLRPEQDSDPFLPICPEPNCTDCAEADPYSYRVHVILPAYSRRFENQPFRRFVESTIREEMPAHILPRICWINKDDMAELEQAYRDWIYLKSGAETAQRTDKLKRFRDALFRVRNVYPPQMLHECDSGEDKPKFLLGQTALGTLEEP